MFLKLTMDSDTITIYYQLYLFAINK